MLSVVPAKRLDEPPFPAGTTSTFDWDSKLTIDIIRAHTKTDDIPAVLDEQIRLYRASAVESAEHYTGLLLSGRRTVTEPISGPSRPRYDKTYYTHRLKYPVADGYVHLYGGTHANDNRTFRVPEGSRKVKVPVVIAGPDLTNCCDPCAKPFQLNGGMMVAYVAGFKDIDSIPVGIIHGMLQFIAWCVEHPGDELLTQRNRVETRAGLAGLQGSNNIAMISGALETWVRYDEERV